MKEKFSLVMDPNKNPLQSLPKSQRFQIMVLLSIMWSSVFCLAFGSWFWWGELVIGHVAVAVAIGITSLTFNQAKKKVIGICTGLKTVRLGMTTSGEVKQ